MIAYIVYVAQLSLERHINLKNMLDKTAMM
uniref:Uncharacterized protein n=1 Tax=Siphoviridae sp. ctXBp18 TaxID=2825541 RepID=A0A8S5PKV3_9CAUD|nr:MAG TPA: hypothetical protein [Siphoviridae sp. ctXBp18]